MSVARSATRNRRRAFTLVEAAVSCVIVSVMLTAALSTAAAARVREQKAIDRQRGLFLAQSLMAEIMDKAYVDPGPLPLFGPEATELLQPRSVYNDVDDYNGLNETPPSYANGTAIAGYARWSRTARVEYVTNANLATVSGADTGLKKITVTVKKGGVPVVEIYALRSRARDAL
jgi:MSHA pilin protein MshD